MRCSFVKRTYLGQSELPAAMRPSNAKVPAVTVEVVILAMIAAFLGLRLYSVLGRRAEHEEEAVQPRIEPKGERTGEIGGDAPGKPRAVAQGLPERAVGSSAAQRPRELPGVLPVAERGLREIAAVDRRFDAILFLQGARGAYRMILEAFWRGDREQLGRLCERDVYESFAAVLDARAAAGETLDNRLVRIEEATIVDASLQSGTARIAVRFRADIAAVTRDARGNVVAGSLDDAVESSDLWTFARDVNSAEPDWLLEETDEA